MARPKLTIQPITVSLKLTLHPEVDDDLIAFFASLPTRGRAQAVMVALRQGHSATLPRALGDANIASDNSQDDMEEALLDMLL